MNISHDFNSTLKCNKIFLSSHYFKDFQIIVPNAHALVIKLVQEQKTLYENKKYIPDHLSLS